ncbi:hypothetical protein [Candidatus Phytoplasma asteris]|uniref:hypothetical protein n=1 Tax=Candidatus Phytoplasma asteris TaxID=85620 RepID=UPI0039DFA987
MLIIINILILLLNINSYFIKAHSTFKLNYQIKSTFKIKVKKETLNNTINNIKVKNTNKALIFIHKNIDPNYYKKVSFHKTINQNKGELMSKSIINCPQNIIFIYHDGKMPFIKDKTHTLEAIINMKNKYNSLYIFYYEPTLIQKYLYPKKTTLYKPYRKK